ncbi:hypothetical protein ABER68_15825 [Paenibacillus alvei]
MLSTLLLIGFIIGIIIYLVTYVYGKGIPNVKRSLSVLCGGIILLLVSILLIGGFEGMPFGIVSIGVISMAIIFFIVGKSSFWKKTFCLIVLLYAVVFSAYTYFDKVNYWVVDKGNVESQGLLTHLHNIEGNPSIRGYKMFNILEGSKGIFLTLGEQMRGNTIELLDVENSNGRTEIKIRTNYNNSLEKNPFIVIGIDKIESEILITDTDGTVYKEISD